MHWVGSLKSLLFLFSFCYYVKKLQALHSFFSIFLVVYKGHPSFKLLFLLLFLAKGWGNWISKLLYFFSISCCLKASMTNFYFLDIFSLFFVILTLSREEGTSFFSCFNVLLLMLVGAKDLAPSSTPFSCCCYLQRGGELQAFCFFSSSCVVVFSLLVFLFLFFFLFVFGCSIDYKGVPMLFIWLFLLLVDDPSSQFSFFLFLCWFCLQKAWSLELLVCFFLSFF